MTTNRPRCPLCNNTTKKNGTTSKGTTRWRCTTCGTSPIKTRPDLTHKHNFTHHITSAQSLTDYATNLGVSRWTLTRRFTSCWYIDVPNRPDPHHIHDQIFIDGT